MDHYELFQQLHYQPRPFILANAWNVKSALIAQAAGFEAIGTSSGAIADSLGYQDGEQIPFEEMLYIVKRIKQAIRIPLSVDMERGYTDDPDQLNHYIQQLLDLGVSGINIEDAQGEAVCLAKLQSIKRYLQQTKQQLFINARTDVFLQKPDAPPEIILRRADLYRQAGADGLFVTGVQDTDTILQLSAGIPLPLNVVATAKLTSYDALAKCGVKRISMAAFLYRATYRQIETTAARIINEKSFSSLHEVITDH